ncbi:hypothetical protein ACOSP6_07610 [Tenacibaculum sp. MEBiC06402]|uniref:hypothetical protein n=1 Tax=unclassified Tenacibaculum TaxID=2635139 RepID=UPI003B9D2563
MQLIRKYISLTLLIIILAPSVIQFSHIIAEEHHDVEVCLSQDEHHYHDHEVECELCKFNLNDFSDIEIAALPIITITEIASTENFYYSFKSEITTSFFLRGPPSLT